MSCRDNPACADSLLTLGTNPTRLGTTRKRLQAQLRMVRERRSAIPVFPLCLCVTVVHQVAWFEPQRH